MKLTLVPAIWIVLASYAGAEQRDHPAASSGRDCFNTSFVSGFSPVDRDTVRLDAGPRRSYDVDLEGPGCDQLNWTESLAIESSPSSWICVGDGPSQGNIYFRDPATRQRTSCFIQNVRRVPETPPAR